MAAENIALGAGELWFAPFKTGTKNPDGSFHLGNCPAFETSIERQVITHNDSRRGIMEEDAEITRAVSLTGSITCDNIRAETLALYFGDTGTTTKTVTSGTVTDEVILGVKKGRTYQLGVTASNPSGARKIASVVVTNDAGSPTTYVANTDYTVDLERGLLTILASGAITNGTNLEVDYSQTAHTRDQIAVGEQAVEGELHYYAYNAEGQDIDLHVPYVKLTPNGAIQWITGEQFMTLNFSIKGLRKSNTIALAYANGQAVT